MQHGFWQSIWISFKKTQGLLIAGVSLLIAIVVWLFSPERNVPLGVFLPVLVGCLLLIITFLVASFDLFQQGKRGLPALLMVKGLHRTEGADEFLYLLEPSDLFSQGIMVSFYYNDNNFEQLIGIGRVVHIQEDKKIQVAMVTAREDSGDIIQRLSNNDAEALTKTKIKPTVPMRDAILV